MAYRFLELPDGIIDLAPIHPLVVGTRTVAARAGSPDTCLPPRVTTPTG